MTSIFVEAVAKKMAPKKRAILLILNDIVIQNIAV